MPIRFIFISVKDGSLKGPLTPFALFPAVIFPHNYVWVFSTRFQIQSWHYIPRANVTYMKVVCKTSIKYFLLWYLSRSLLICALELTCSWKFVGLLDIYVCGNRTAKAIMTPDFFLNFMGYLQRNMGSLCWKWLTFRSIPSASTVLKS